MYRPRIAGGAGSRHGGGALDTHPSTATEFEGLWGVFPYYADGTIVGSDVYCGLYVWKLALPPRAPPAPPPALTISCVDANALYAEQCCEEPTGAATANGETVSCVSMRARILDACCIQPDSTITISLTGP